jgi:SNF2 family DNA or RNA helicase
MLKTDLLPHQLLTVDFILSKKYCGDFSALGTGKSLSSIAAIKKIGKKAVVVTPPYLVSNWCNEFSKHSNLKAVPHFLRYDPTADVHVVPYTQLNKCDDIFKNCPIVISDESHHLKNLQAKRTQHFHTLMYKHKPEYYVYISATPVKNRLPDIYSFLLLLAQAPNVTNKITDKYKSYYSFCCRFTNVTQSKFGVSYSGMKNVEELRTYLKPWTIKHTNDVLDLPELSESELVVSYGEDMALQKAFSQFTDGRVTGEITVKVQSACAKAKFTANYVESALESDEGPIVIFSDHRKPLDIIELELSNYRVRQITGDISMVKRVEYIDMLNNKQLDVLLLTYGAGSSGINLTSSNLMVLTDLPWNVSDFEQAKKRSHRMGQTRNCRIVHVIGSKVDELILRSLRAKAKVINKTLE